MAYEVRLSRRAISNLRDIYSDKSAESSPPAHDWYLGLRDMIFSLRELPYRGVVAPDRPSLRHLLYGNKPHVYRILYSVDENAQVVYVAQVRHGARKPLS